MSLPKRLDRYKRRRSGVVAADPGNRPGWHPASSPTSADVRVPPNDGRDAHVAGRCPLPVTLFACPSPGTLAGSTSKAPVRGERPTQGKASQAMPGVRLRIAPWAGWPVGAGLRFARAGARFRRLAGCRSGGVDSRCRPEEPAAEDGGAENEPSPPEREAAEHVRQPVNVEQDSTRGDRDGDGDGEPDKNGPATGSGASSEYERRRGVESRGGR